MIGLAAISLLGRPDDAAAGLQYVGGASGGSTGASYSVSLASLGIQTGDIVVVATGTINNGTSQASLTCSGNNSGAYTTNTAASEGTDTWDCTFKIFYKVMGGTPDTSLSMARAAGAAYGGSTAVHVWRNVNATPIDTTGTAATGTNTGRGDPPAITPANAGAIILACGVGAQAPGGSAFTVPSGMSNGVSVYTDGSTSGCGVFIASDVWISGSYNPAAWTGGSDSTNASWIANTIALRPA